MKTNLLVNLARFLFVGVFIVSMFAIVCENSAGKPSTKEKVTLAINTFKNTFSLGEPVTLVVAVAYSGDKTLYVRWTPVFVVITDSNGDMVEHDPWDTPPPPPADWYIERDGEMVFVEPVDILGHKSGIVELVSDALEGYHMTEGEYVVTVEAALAIHPETAIIDREEFPGQKWAIPGSLVTQVIIQSNAIKIEIGKTGKQVAKQPKPEKDKPQPKAQLKKPPIQPEPKTELGKRPVTEEKVTETYAVWLVPVLVVTIIVLAGLVFFLLLRRKK